MLTLSNDDLDVHLLDPNSASDRERQGTRYCWGGYIWQVHDREHGPLLAGPEFPQPAPSAFNGQGLPESFRSHAFGSNDDLTVKGGRGFVLGVGEVTGVEAREMDLVAPCQWEIAKTGSALSFVTEQAVLGFGAQVERTVSLAGRTLTSSTSVRNTADSALPLHWFAHPFFALTEGLIACTLTKGWGKDENAGFALDGDHRLTQLRRFRDQFDGHFEELAIEPNSPLDVAISHPLLGAVSFAADFVPDRCPVWGNSNTWSVEPYIETELAPGDLRSWRLTYRF